MYCSYQYQLEMMFPFFPQLLTHQKLEWEYLSIDLLPHPDMFTEAHFASSLDGSNRKDDDGAKRVFFGGERFIEEISGEAYVMHITTLEN